MLIKIAGALLLVAGVALALPMAGGLIGGLFSLAWTGIKVACVGGLVYVGWRWLNGDRKVISRMTRRF